MAQNRPLDPGHPRRNNQWPDHLVVKPEPVEFIEENGGGPDVRLRKRRLRKK
jgi:hypothetical protein